MNTVELAKILSSYPNLVQLVQGQSHTQVEKLNSPSLAQKNEMIFASDIHHLQQAFTSKSQVWVIHKSLYPFPQDIMSATPSIDLSSVHILVTQNVPLSIAQIGKTFFPQLLNKVPFLESQNIHPTAVVHPSAKIAPDVIIGPLTSIGKDVVIEEKCIIGSHTTIEAETHIGSGTHIHPQVYLAYGTKIGKDCEIQPQTSIGSEGFGYAYDEKGKAHRMTHYGRVVIEDRVHIGSGVQVDRGTFADSVIGSGTIIDNHCHFGHNIKIGKDTIITGGMLAAGSVTIGNRCVFGGRTTIAGHLTIADRSQFSGLSGILSSVKEPGQYGGYPLQSLQAALKTTATLIHLPKIRKNLAQVLKLLSKEFVGENKQ